ncbi:hypothetical protein SA496_14225 [Pseudomonas sp. JS3066]|uniref:hypothetical protein n=1 Tax=Pseudomonas sp. JS3066 TaxID=3090665 RepID=UPI002E7B624D|nr:hypothetical protein [Pseudomonas sp. JS3066]WVK90902.1 hypothetical protein SA496_14225 [Pseudomonas sp. JS3066]
MAFKVFGDQEFDKVRHAVAESQRIKQRAKTLMENIRAVCESEYPKESWGIELQIGEDGNVGIQTPYGRGRARLVMSLGENGTQGIYRIEREALNCLDQSEWRHVWSIRLDGKGLYPANDPNTRMQFGGFRDDDNYAELALSILYAIACGHEQ